MWTSSDVTWSPRVKFSMLAHSRSHQNRKHRATFRSIMRRPVTHILSSWMGKRTERNFYPDSLRDGEKRVKCCRNDSLVPNLFLSDSENVSIGRRPQTYHQVRDQVVEEPWLLHSSLLSHHVADLETSSDFDCEGDIPNSNFLNHSRYNEDPSHMSDFDANEKESNYETNGSLLTNHPVEEPWMLESSTYVDHCTVNIVSDASKDESSKDYDNLSLTEQHQLIPGNLLHKDESNVMPEDDSVFTVILINSSICTMQRIAVLENDKLVELLLEPVKNNVQCDNVYLGIVTKLVPHMGGAFVNIGSSRPAFMDIKPYREPFILPTFPGHLKEKDVNYSIFDKSGEHEHFIEKRNFSDEVEEADQVEDDQSEDEFVDDEYEGHENRFHFDALELMKESINGSAVGHELQADAERFSEELNGDADQFRAKSIQQGPGNIKVMDREESKWAQVRKGSKIIVQVVKEGLGTKGPTLTPHPRLRSRFWFS